MPSLTSPSFQRLIQTLRRSKKTLTTIEQSCGGTISASLMSQPNSSSVFYGGSVVYNTQRGKGLLLGEHHGLHASLTTTEGGRRGKGKKEEYVGSKFDWTAKTSVAFCDALGVDYAVAEGGAAGPTFTCEGMESGFAVLCVAGRRGRGGEEGGAVVRKQRLVRSDHADRQGNMRLFADAAAELIIEVIEEEEKEEEEEEMVTEHHKEAACDAGVHNENNGNDGSNCFDEPNLVLDRATKLRSNKQAIAEMEPRAKYAIVHKNKILLRSNTELALLSNDEVTHFKEDTNNNQLTFLGILNDKPQTPIFGIDLLSSPPSPPFPHCTFADTRTSAPLLPPLHNSLALHLTAYTTWQRSSPHCPQCGSSTTLLHAGTTRHCPSCGTLSYPRQDPSIITSIISRCGERILLARSPRHPRKMFTVLAGFVEAGETFEDAVAREVWEEVGVRIDRESVRYVGSQPWPFPRSCMVAFTATADDSGGGLEIDEEEILEAGWFGREEVGRAAGVEEGRIMRREVAERVLEDDPGLRLLVPPKQVVARTLIDRWLDDK